MSKMEKLKVKLAALLLSLSTVKTDKAVLEYDGEDLAVEADVFVTDENGERKPAEDGEYKTEDNKVITVADGKVSSIVEVEEELAEETPTEEEIETPTEEEVKEEVTEEVEAEDVVEEPTSNAIEEIRKEIDELYKLVDSILDKIGETRKEADERLSKIEKMSAAKPAASEIENININLNATGDKRAKRLAELSKNWKNI